MREDNAGPREVVPISPRTFQHGYPDFMPHDIQMTTLTGPPRTSMLDDLCFYLRQHSGQLTAGLDAGPDAIAVFVKKVVAAQYLELFNFARAVVSQVQWSMSRQDRVDLGSLDVASVEAQWSDVQALERRANEYCEDLDAAMLQCGIPLADRPDPAACAVAPVVPGASVAAAAPPQWDDVTAEFQLLRLWLGNVRRRAELLNAAVTGLASMSGNRQALREAKSTKALTLLGLIFIPLAYTASLFSMTEPYGPGHERFWMYFAISLPLILCVVGIYTVVEVASGGDSLLSKSLLPLVRSTK